AYKQCPSCAAVKPSHFAFAWQSKSTTPTSTPGVIRSTNLPSRFPIPFVTNATPTVYQQCRVDSRPLFMSCMAAILMIDSAFCVIHTDHLLRAVENRDSVQQEVSTTILVHHATIRSSRIALNHKARIQGVNVSAEFLGFRHKTLVFNKSANSDNCFWLVRSLLEFGTSGRVAEPLASALRPASNVFKSEHVNLLKPMEAPSLHSSSLFHSVGVT
ncbi:hypothetical protein TSMEX_005323, partial [Taenia solium]